MTNGKVPFTYWLLTGFTGLAASLFISGWVRQLSLIFGIHPVSIVTLMISVFLCLCIGSFISGRLSEHARQPVLYFISFTLIVLIFVLARKVILEEFRHLLERIYRLRQPGTFGTGIIRFIFSLAFLLIPLSLLSALLPLLFRYFIRSISQSGQFMSATLISVSVAGLTAVVLTVFYLVPAFGINGIFYAGIIVLIVLSGTGLILKFRKQSAVTREKKIAGKLSPTTIRFKKKKTVLEISVKLTRAMLKGSVFHAFSFSAMLILSFRILIKYNSTTPVFFYSIVLILSLCGIISGSLLYKRIADRPANKFLTLATLQVVAGFAALICYAFLHFFALKIFTKLPDTGTLLQIALRQSALFAVLLFIPSAIYGISFPLAARLYPKRIQHTGRNFAKLNCLVFFSVISAMIITPFILIPLAGIELSFILLSLIMLLSGVYLILRDSRLIRGFRVGYGFLAIVLFIIIASFVYLLDFRQSHDNAGGSVEGSTASISMTEQHGDKYIYFNNTYYFGSDPLGLKEQVLAAAIPAVLKPGADSALLIGFGTGITASILDQSGVSSLEITEIFPEIIRMSSINFADENSDILTGPRTEVSIDDARSFLFRKQGHFDLITMGSDQISFFPGRYTSEFYRLCKSKLSDEGIFCQIIPLNSNFSSILKTAASAFESNSLWLISSEKLLLVSSKIRLKINYCRLSEMFGTLNNKGQLSRIGINDPTVMAGHLLLANDEITGLTNNSGIITDNYPYSSLTVNTREIASPLPMIQKYSGTNNYFDFSGNCIEDSSAIPMRIKQINRSLVQQAVESSSKPRQRIVDFFEVNRSLLQQYL